MQLQSVLSPVEQFILDCADLASALDNLDLRADNPGSLTAAAMQGRYRFDALLLQRQSRLSPTVVEAGWIDFMLDNVRSRLQFVESRVQQIQPRASNPGSSLNPSLP